MSELLGVNLTGSTVSYSTISNRYGHVNIPIPKDKIDSCNLRMGDLIESEKSGSLIRLRIGWCGPIEAIGRERNSHALVEIATEMAKRRS